MSQYLRRRLALTLCAMATGALALATPTALHAQAPAPAGPEQVVASLKQSLANSQQRLRQYQWIETTVISLKGEEKSRKEEQVYYGADGALVKLPVPGAAAAPPPPSGGRGGRLKEKVKENKVDEMKDYMDRATKLIHLYVPPAPARIQQAKDAGHVQLTPQGPGGVRVEFPAFVQPGDLLAIDVDTAAYALKTVSVNTYLDKPSETVTLNVQYGTLNDGTSYAAQTTLDAAAKKIRVVVTNSGHRPLSGR